jgi:choline dehydrogenase-like flavoprotein
MRFYVSKDGDTLRKISKIYGIDIKDLLTLNPNILSPEINIPGIIVKIPSPDRPVIDQTSVPLCSFDPSSEDILEDWIPIKSLEQMAKTDYDVIIVGTGAGGGAVLRRLCERWKNNGKRIGIIERGNLLLPTHVRNIPTMNNQRFGLYFQGVSNWIGKLLPEFSGARQLFALGGRTLFWGMSAPRMDVSEITKWPVTKKEMDFYYNIAEQVMDVSTEYMKDSSLQEILLNRLRENGFPEAADVPAPADLEPTKYGQIHSDPFWSSISALAYALNRKPFDLAVNANAVEVLVDKGKTVGLKVMSPEKKSYFLKAKTVVLSGSTFETPRLLLNSGIQGRAIGHYLTNHSFLLAIVKVSRNDFPEVLGPLSVMIPQTKERPYQIQMGGPGEYLWYQRYEQQPLLDELHIGISVFGKVESRFENKIFLDPYKQDEYGVPEIQVHFSYSEKDKAIINQMASALTQVVSAIGASFISTDGNPAICLMPPGSDYHESVTCRMGDDPNTSATNRYGQIHGISGLYVADNSMLPSLGAANPTLTTVALSVRVADYISYKLK